MLFLMPKQLTVSEHWKQKFLYGISWIYYNPNSILKVIFQVNLGQPVNPPVFSTCSRKESLGFDWHRFLRGQISCLLTVSLYLNYVCQGRMMWPAMFWFCRKYEYLKRFLTDQICWVDWMFSEHFPVVEMIGKPSVVMVNVSRVLWRWMWQMSTASTQGRKRRTADNFRCVCVLLTLNSNDLWTWPTY